MSNQRVRIAARIGRRPFNDNGRATHADGHRRKIIVIASFMLVASCFWLMAAFANEHYVTYEYVNQVEEDGNYRSSYRTYLENLHKYQQQQLLAARAESVEREYAREHLDEMAQLESVLRALPLDGEAEIESMVPANDGLYLTIGYHHQNGEAAAADDVPCSHPIGDTLAHIVAHVKELKQEVDEVIQVAGNSTTPSEKHDKESTLGRLEAKFSSLYSRLTRLSPEEKGKTAKIAEKVVTPNDVASELFLMYMDLRFKLDEDTTLNFDNIAKYEDDSADDLEEFLKGLDAGDDEHVEKTVEQDKVADQENSTEAADQKNATGELEDSKTGEKINTVALATEAADDANNLESTDDHASKDQLLARKKRGMDYHKYFTTGGGELPRDEASAHGETSHPDTIGDMNTVPGYMRFRVRPPGSPVKYTEDTPFMTDNMKCALTGLALFIVGAIGSALFFCKPEEEIKREQEACRQKAESNLQSAIAPDDTTEGEPTDQDVDSALME